LLNNDEVLSETSFHNSTVKASKVKYLIEELPTVEHIKKRRPDLYKNWFCPMCENEREYFAHVWSCPRQLSNTNYVINLAKCDLIASLLFVSPSLKKQKIIDIFSSMKIWNPSFDLLEISFIDLIKGFVPRDLVDIILELGLSYKDTKDVIINFMNNLQNIIKEHVWIPRCNKQLHKEESIGITSRIKKKKKNCIDYFSRPRIDQDPNTLIIGNWGLEWSIRLGGDFLNFMFTVNYRFNSLDGSFDFFFILFYFYFTFLLV